MFLPSRSPLKDYPLALYSAASIFSGIDDAWMIVGRGETEHFGDFIGTRLSLVCPVFGRPTLSSNWGPVGQHNIPVTSAQA